VTCPVIQKRFHQLVNMSSAQIRAWAKDPRAKCASFQETRDRLPMLADLKAKGRRKWNQNDCAYAERVISFNSRMQGMVDKWGCKPRAVLSLRNWGRMPPACHMEDVNALGKACRRRR
jgi:hypothetical protein